MPFQKGHKRLKLTDKGDFKKGHIPWNRGKKMTYKNPGERNKKIKENNARYWLNKKRPPFSKKWRENIGKSNKDEKSHFWIDGRTPENIKIRNSIEYRFWVEGNFARDNYTCQRCGQYGGKLRVHHIQNFAQYPELRFAIDNGIIFCEKCHKEFHKKYGVKNNTKEQIKEFLEKK